MADGNGTEIDRSGTEMVDGRRSTSRLVSGDEAVEDEADADVEDVVEELADELELTDRLLDDSLPWASNSAALAAGKCAQ